ncbi:MAG: hypothetical protein L0211_00305 [Planctomycetaceae bacterium]|nr:hypothetical protein [Planctomycetaceae bacterium]
MFGQILVEFVFRLIFGVAVAMGLTRSDQVTSGFYRIHLWVLLGLETVAFLAIYSRPQVRSTHVPFSHWQLACALIGAIVCYVGASIWLYERRRAGKFAIWLVAALSLAALLLPIFEPLVYPQFMPPAKPVTMQIADRVTSSLLLGLVTTAMLLGHWYLNTPTMKLQPLRRLIVLLAAATVARAIVCGSGLGMELAWHATREGSALTTWLVFVAMRWLAGIVGVFCLAWLTWLVLKIPNTQSATGLLYAGVIVAFIGELTSQLLTAEAVYPL